MNRSEQRRMIQGLRAGLKLRLAEFDPLVDLIQEALLQFHNDHHALDPNVVEELLNEARRMGVVWQHVPKKIYQRRKPGSLAARRDEWLSR